MSSKSLWFQFENIGIRKVQSALKGENQKDIHGYLLAVGTHGGLHSLLEGNWANIDILTYGIVLKYTQPESEQPFAKWGLLALCPAARPCLF